MPTPSSPVPLNPFHYLETLWNPGEANPFAEIIDVRAPCEFAEDHLLGAINLPVLDDREREEVGTLFRQRGAFTARRLGASYVSQNISQHLANHFHDKPKDYRPMIYCWRGGQRSASMAVVLAQVGWRVTVLQGGYKTYRQHVRQMLDTLPTHLSYRVISGATGTGKTKLLQAIHANGGQVLDLEGLANHRGSLLGGQGPQPSQKLFESLLYDAIPRFDPAQPVWVEAESKRIGNLFVPSALWAKMQQADGVELRVPNQARVAHLLADYTEMIAHSSRLKELLTRLVPRHGRKQIQDWLSLIDLGQWEDLVRSLLAVHYDPAYQYSAEKYYSQITRPIELQDTSMSTVNALAVDLLDTYSMPLTTTR